VIWGFDGGKLVKGRKRHVGTDTLGMLLGLVVTEANLGDRAGAKLVAAQFVGRFPRLAKLFADQGYGGPDLAAWLAERGGWELEIVRGEDGQRGFVVQAKRWIVERTLGWLNQYRRLSKDYEELPVTSEAMIRIAMIHVMLKRLAK
jgi:putative transposase